MQQTVTMTVQEFEEAVAKAVQRHKCNKSAFHKIIDEFNKDFEKIGISSKAKNKIKSSVTALATVYFEMRTPTGFQTEKADELRQLIQDIISVMIKKERINYERTSDNDF